VNLKVNKAIQSIIRIIKPKHQDAKKSQQRLQLVQPDAKIGQWNIKWGVGAALVLLVSYKLWSTSVFHSAIDWLRSLFEADALRVPASEAVLAIEPFWVYDRLLFLNTY